ncbi:MAG: ABC transporter substrate-binding protein, partial [Vicinamibacteria bacterium]
MALLGTAGCRAPRAAAGQQLRIGHESEVASFDPVAYPEVVTWSVLGNLYEGLLTFDRDMKLTSSLAESWTSPDDRTWVFELRKGVRFHDGRLLTAEDVRYSIDRARGGEPSSSLKGYLATIERVEVLGPHTVRIAVGRPDSLLLNRLVHALILPAGYTDFRTHPIGTGPYRFVRWEKDVLLEAEAFPQYWQGKPQVARVQFLPVGDAEKGIALLRSGGLDVLRHVPEGSAGRVRETPHVRLVTRAGVGAYYLWFDCHPRIGDASNPFADKRVRQAISRAIDRQEIARRLGGLVAPMNQLVHDAVVGYDPELPPLRFDPAEARRLLAQAAKSRELKVTLTHRPQPSLAIVSDAIRDMLGRVGIEVAVETEEWPR